ncbi:MAG TPA: class I SAM-dependent methyltransferase [Pseudonocardiaceae bacterium]|jgi:protein-L-isoaspartate O-methyltransferase|nr:class I SAM-dependent methyltransferase [Pseudonocardiaceae bacterium]
MPTTWLDTLIKQTRRIGDFPFPHQAAFLLDNPIRRFLTDPKTVIDQLKLTGHEQVLELGPGPGFYSVAIARELTDGRLELFDLQPQMLDKARRKLDRAGCHNVDFRSGEASAALPFADRTFDVAFLAAVIGEVPDKTACVRALADVLKPGGVLAFYEGVFDPDRFSVAQLRTLVEPEGFAFLDTAGNRWHDFVRFTRLETP